MKTLIFIAIAVVMSVSVFGQQTTKPVSEKSLFWFSDDPAVEVVLIDRGAPFNLIVISKKDVKVTYRTEINSTEPVVEDLMPIRSYGARKYFFVRHSFSRRTIWMALDFSAGGKPLPGLTRTFYNGLLELVPNEQFTKTVPQ